MPAGTDWKMISGVSLLGGIGFTVSLFIANLSFTGDAASVAILNNAKLGIVVGSLIAGILGYCLLAATLPKENVE
ncbi:MAG: Na+/H+ antiporter NhaA, partial [Muribaculaceae bacterium]|nr:Na+/H+ antiporter NhaA [Muribaculaceae bacterium]